MQRRLTIFLLFFMFCLLLGILFVLFAAGAFLSVAAETENLIGKELHYISQNVKIQYGKASVQAVWLSEALSSHIENYMNEAGIDAADMKSHPEMLEGLLRDQLNVLLLAQGTTDCSGAFMVLDATVNPYIEGAETSRAGLYVRNIEPSMSGMVRNKSLFRGFPSLSTKGSLFMQSNWDLEFDIQGQRFYSEPIAAYTANPRLPLSRLYYWTHGLPGLNEAVMLCGLPLVGKSGQPFGVCGFEISQMNFMLRHNPDNSLYANTVCLIAPLNENGLDLGKALFSGSAPAYRTFPGGRLGFSGKIKRLTVYEASGRQFVGLHEEIALYPKDSPFAGNRFAVVAIIPKEDFERVQSARNSRVVLFFGILACLGALFSVMLSRRYVKPIADRLEEVKIDSANGVTPKTNIQEIDTLIERLLKIHSNGNPVSFSLFEDFVARVKTLTPTQEAVFRYHAEGKSAEEILSLMRIAIGTLRNHNTHIFSKLNVSSRDEMLAYVELIKKCGMLSEIVPADSENSPTLGA
jgi:DNA-binding CsgD family transcriptional regulator